jgi:hypothetical protein
MLLHNPETDVDIVMDVVAETASYPDGTISVMFPELVAGPFITGFSRRVSSTRGFLVTRSSRERSVRADINDCRKKVDDVGYFLSQYTIIII